MRFGPRRTIGKGLAGLLLYILAATTILPSARAADTGTDGGKPLSGITDIAYGSQLSAALASDGTIWYWSGNGEARRGPVVKDASQLTSDLVLKKDGTVWSWNSESGTVVQVEGLGGIAKITSGQFGHLALERSGKLWAWGGTCQVALATKNAYWGDICSSTDSEAVKQALDELEIMPALVGEHIKDADFKADLAFIDASGTVIQHYSGDNVHFGFYSYKVPAPREALAVTGTSTPSNRGIVFILDDKGSIGIGGFDVLESYKWNVTFKSMDGGVTGSAYALAIDNSDAVWALTGFGNKPAAVRLPGLGDIRKVVARSINSGLALTEDGRVMRWGPAEPDWQHESTALTANVHPQPVNAAISVTWNGKPMVLSAAPVLRDGTVLVPMRELFEAFGTTVAYKDSVVSAAKGSRAIKLTVYSRTAVVDGRKVALGTAPTYVGGKTYVPLRFLSESLGAKVAWETDRNNAAIVLPAG
ncbi:stalk domain-containing protein [Cohnella sp. 56]|uniref:stalk domain-containing protein n=1 Tax=Cohnella sp. 56 TaxID=3113722 RepID=UPI0030E99DB3